MDETEMLPTNSSVIVERVPLELANYVKSKTTRTFRDYCLANQKVNSGFNNSFNNQNSNKGLFFCLIKNILYRIILIKFFVMSLNFLF